MTNPRCIALFAAALVASNVAIAQEFGTRDREAAKASFPRLLVDPQKLDGAKVLVRGFLRIDSHDWDLCMSREDLLLPAHLSEEDQSCLRLYFDWEATGLSPDRLPAFDGHLAYVEGVFVAFDQVPIREYVCVDNELTFGEYDPSLGYPGHITQIQRLRVFMEDELRATPE